MWNLRHVAPRERTDPRAMDPRECRDLGVPWAPSGDGTGASADVVLDGRHGAMLPLDFKALSKAYDMVPREHVAIGYEATHRTQSVPRVPRISPRGTAGARVQTGAVGSNRTARRAHGNYNIGATGATKALRCGATGRHGCQHVATGATRRGCHGRHGKADRTSRVHGSTLGATGA